MLQTAQQPAWVANPHLCPESIDVDGLIRLAAAIVVRAACDYIQQHDESARDFLDAAGVLERAAVIVQYAPSMCRNRWG